MTATQIRLARRPEGEPDDSCFSFVTEEVPTPGEGQVLLRVVYLSLDPYMRGRMSAAKSYAAPVEVGDVLVGGTVCVVVESRTPTGPPATGAVLLRLADPPRQRRRPPYAGSTRPRRPCPRRSVCWACPASPPTPGCWRSAGRRRARPSSSRPPPDPVGSAVGQIAKVKGARAVGIAGGPEKCAGAARGVRLRRRRRPPLADLRRGPEGGRARRHRRLLRERRRPRSSTRWSRGSTSTRRVPVCGLVANYNATSAPEGPDRLPGFMGQFLTAEPHRARLHPGRVHQVPRPRLRARHDRLGRRRVRALPRGRRRGAGERTRGVPRHAAGADFGKLLVKREATLVEVAERHRRSREGRSAQPEALETWRTVRGLAVAPQALGERLGHLNPAGSGALAQREHDAAVLHAGRRHPGCPW